VWATSWWLQSGLVHFIWAVVSESDGVSAHPCLLVWENPPWVVVRVQGALLWAVVCCICDGKYVDMSHVTSTSRRVRSTGLFVYRLDHCPHGANSLTPHRFMIDMIGFKLPPYFSVFLGWHLGFSCGNLTCACDASSYPTYASTLRYTAFL
jgi:hypothetical protein